MVDLFFRGHLNQHLSIGPPILWVRNLGKKQQAKLCPHGQWQSSLGGVSGGGGRGGWSGGPEMVHSHASGEAGGWVRLMAAGWTSYMAALGVKGRAPRS